jgi:hypothetical protein
VAGLFPPIPPCFMLNGWSVTVMMYVINVVYAPACAKDPKTPIPSGLYFSSSIEKACNVNQSLGFGLRLCAFVS